MSLKNMFHDSWLHPRHLNKKYIHQLLFSLQGHAKGRMLDIGCGLKPYEKLYQERVSNYIGIDWPASPGKAKPDIVADALSLPIRQNTLDTVLATELLEHLPEPDKFIAEVARVLRLGGAFILTVPFLEPLHEEPRDYFRFTKHGLRAILDRHGFSIKKTCSRGGLAAVLGSFFAQSLYELANPANEQGLRQNRLPGLILSLPVISCIQLLAYAVDSLSGKSKFTLGYAVLAVLNRK